MKNNFSHTRFIKIALLLAVCGYFVFYKGYYLKSDSQFVLYQISITLSGILFGVLGIWVSTVYNESWGKFISGGRGEQDEAKVEIKYLIEPMFMSIVCIVASIGFFIMRFELAENFSLSVEHKRTLLKLSFSLYMIITLVQLGFLFVIFKPLFSLLRKIRSVSSQRDSRSRRFGKTSSHTTKSQDSEAEL